MLKKQRGTISIITLFAGGLLCVFCAPALAQTIEIDSIEELQKIGNDPGYPLSGDYILTQNIDASTTVGWNDGSGFIPIGKDSANSFIGHLDGQGYIITNLYIGRSSEFEIIKSGLFGHIGSSGRVENLGLENLKIVSSHAAGGLAYSNGGVIYNVHVTGTVTGKGFNGVGGLVDLALNTGSITQSYTDVEVSGYDYSGGLVGLQYGGTIANCYSKGRVLGARDYAGGLIGAVNTGGIVSNSYSTGSVIALGSGVGGLTGKNQGTITDCYATGEVISGPVTNGSFSGGLVGNNLSGSLTRCYAIGSVTGDIRTGGLAGYSGGSVTQCYATGAVTGYTDVGGLLGSYSNQVTQCYATGSVTGSQRVGGLAGTANSGSTLSECYALGKVTGEASVRGLVGQNSGSISRSFWDLDTTGQPAPLGGATGLPSTQMMQMTTFQGGGWNFVDAWRIREEDSYPFFQWSSPLNQTCTLEVSNSGNGIVTLSPPVNEVEVWSLVEITAEPATGYVFAGWVGTGFGDSPHCRLNPIALVTGHSLEIEPVFLPDGPIQISTIEDLQKIASESHYPAYWQYEITQDLDAIDTENWNNGLGFSPLLPFRGILDGQGHSITGLTINSPEQTNVGLFRALFRGSEIRNCVLENITVNGSISVGGLVGNGNYGTITGSKVSGCIQGLQYVGGLVGHMEYTTISNCNFNGDVTVITSAGGGLRDIFGIFALFLDAIHQVRSTDRRV